MMMITRGLVLGACLGGLAVGWASPASAELPDGTYNATVTGGSGHYRMGSVNTAIFTSCGPDCLNVKKAPGVSDLHPQGNIWSGSFQVGDLPDPCTFTLDSNTLVLTEQCPSFDLVVQYALTKR